MKTTELRIGNKIQIGHTMVTVSEILDGEIETPEEGIIAISHSQISGIPLTSEWMVKLGFASHGRGKWEHVTMPVEIYWNERMDFYYGNAVGISLDYLHQLQNLYFALTGKELTLSSPR